MDKIAHIKSHLRMISLRNLFVVLILFIGSIIVHIIAYLYDDSLFQAIASRVYYIPVLYASLCSGVASGFIAALIAAAAQLAIVYWSGTWQGTVIQIEHYVEFGFLIAIGLLTGIIQDHYHFEREQARSVTDLFGRYVSPDVLAQARKEEIDFEGEEKSASVVFSDLVGFTSLAESIPATELFRLLNLYFKAMVEVVHHHSGYIDKFIGDSVMALFGVPIDLANHPSLAVKSAIAMHHRLHALNRTENFKDLGLAMRIGIHSGKLIAGNLGSEDKLEYTVIGDTVNLASRIESLNRKYNSHILITDATYKAIREDDSFLIREVDAVRVKGRKRPVVLYEVYNCCMAPELDQKAKTLADFASALQFYKSENWEAAEGKFRQVLKDYPTDAISGTYLKRIEYLSKNPPDNWDGVFDYDSK